MTHVQKFWTAAQFIGQDPNIKESHVKELRSWITSNSHLPNFISDEQIILFFHSCYYDMEQTKKCIEDYYRLRLKTSQFFEGRDVNCQALERALKVLHFGIFPQKTPQNYQIVFHKLNNTDPANYVFNDGFKLLAMMIDAVYAKEGPLPGILIVFDLSDVKMGHITKLPLNSVRKCLEYIQDAIPIRLKGIHVLNVHPVIDKIMLLIRPFLRKAFLGLVHFYKENDEEIYKHIPKNCLPKDYGGELESVHFYHEEFVKEMKRLRPMFLEEEELMFRKPKRSKPKILDSITHSAKVEID